MTSRALRTALVLVTAWMIAQSEALAADGASLVRSESDYAAAFDRETGGRFSKLVAAGDLEQALAAYPRIVHAFRKIVDELFQAYSPHANTLPAWYQEQLLAMGLGGLRADGPGLAFLSYELDHDDFDRVAHAYFLASRSHIPLSHGEAPSALWQQMLSVARNDSQHRYWISLQLAESRFFVGSFHERRTKMAEGTISVRERIHQNADWLGPRIPRVLGLEPPDVQVAHLYIRYAKDAAAWRVRSHALASMPASDAYRLLRDELEEMETGTFRSRRFLIVMEKEMPFLLEHFGLPEDPEAMIESLRFLCRGRGSNRQALWAAADALGRHYEEAMAARPQPPPEKPPPSVEEIVAMGDGAWPYLESALADTDEPARLRRVFETDVVPRLAADRPPRDAKRLRNALREAWYVLDYPNDLRTQYEAALDALGPEQSVHGAASKEMLASLTRAFASATSVAAFDEAFTSFRVASRRGLVPSRGADPAFVAAFSTASVRLLDREHAAASAAGERASSARRDREDAALRIEAAEVAVIESNARVRDANRAVATEQAREQEAIAAYNAAIVRVNDAVDKVNRAQRQKSPDLASLQEEAKKLEAELDATLATNQQAANEAGAAMLAAEEQATRARNRAEREQASAKRQVARENEALASEQEAQTERKRRASTAAALLAQLVTGLDLVGLRGDVAAIGDDSRDPDERVAALARWLADPARDTSTDLDAASSASDERLRALARLAGGRGATLPVPQTKEGAL